MEKDKKRTLIIELEEKKGQYLADESERKKVSL